MADAGQAGRVREMIRERVAAGVAAEAPAADRGDEDAPFDAYAIKLVRKLELQDYLNTAALAANQKRYRHLAAVRKHIFVPYLDYSLAMVLAYLLFRRRLGLLNVGGLALGAALANEYARVAHISTAYPDETAELFRLGAEVRQIMRILQRDYAHRYPLRRYAEFMQKESTRSAGETRAMEELFHRRAATDLPRIARHSYHSTLCL